MSKKNQKHKVVSKINSLRNSRECLFKDVPIPPTSNRKERLCAIKCTKNHIVSEKNYLESVSEDNNKVLVFNWEGQEYYKTDGKLSIRNINNANKYKVLCGTHDDYLFSEIEKGNNFDEHNKKQCFQFFLRSIVFHVAESEIKQNFELVHEKFEKVAQVNLHIDNRDLKKLKQALQNECWDDVQTVTIRIKGKRANFVLCQYGKVVCDINKPFLSTGRLSLNIFPDNNDTIILLSYLSNQPNSIRKYCENLATFAKRNESKFIQYISKISVATATPSFAINPTYWDRMLDREKESFYKCAKYFKHNNGFFKPLLKWVIFSQQNFNFNLFSSK